jgi:hypothetical protein
MQLMGLLGHRLSRTRLFRLCGEANVNVQTRAAINRFIK